MVKRFTFFFFKFIVFLNFLFFKITKRNFLFYLKQFLREDSYQTIKILGQNVSFFVPNLLTKWRVDTLFFKEPETLEWIDNFENGGGGVKKLHFGISVVILAYIQFMPLLSTKILMLQPLNHLQVIYKL
jgi:hypothetical protein